MILVEIYTPFFHINSTTTRKLRPQTRQQLIQ